MNILQYINAETDPRRIYEGVRERLRELDRRGRYPDDWQIKNIQRATDSRYEELTKTRKE